MPGPLKNFAIRVVSPRTTVESPDTSQTQSFSTSVRIWGTVTLRDRTGVPALGLGTYRNDDPEECATSVRSALETGYRHIDTAEAYGNEVAVGEGIRGSDVPREEVFLATKVLHPKFTESYEIDDIVAAGHACLDRLEVDTVELFYGIHWPDGEPPAYDVEKVARACERLYEAGAFEHLGVCNLTPPLIDDFRAAVDLPVVALQVEMHPLLPQRHLREYAAEHGLDVVAYAPLGNGRVFDNSTLQDIAETRGVSVARVSLAWLREQGVAAIPKATGTAHIRDNYASLDLQLTDEELETIDGIETEERVYDPDYAPNW